MKDAYYTVEQEMLKETLQEVFLTNFLCRIALSNNALQYYNRTSVYVIINDSLYRNSRI